MWLEDDCEVESHVNVKREQPFWLRGDTYYKSRHESNPYHSYLIFILQLQKLGYSNMDALDASQGMLDIAAKKNIYKNTFCSLIGTEGPIKGLKEGLFVDKNDPVGNIYLTVPCMYILIFFIVCLCMTGRDPMGTFPGLCPSFFTKPTMTNTRKLA